MSRAYRIHDQQALYFITMTVVDWIDLFTRDPNRKIIIQGLEYCRQKKGLNVYAYVIMTNHIHLIVSTDKSLSAIIRDFKRHTTKMLLVSIQHEVESRRDWMMMAFANAGKSADRQDVDHQIWQTGSHAVYLESYKFIAQKLVYIHNNPVRAGFVDDPTAWVYSSQRNYMGMKGMFEIDLLDI